MRRAVDLPRLLAIVVLTLVAAVTLLRAGAAFRSDLLTAADERRLHDWAAGDAALEDRLAAVAAALPPDAGVRLIVPPGTDEGWATYRGLYHLPQQRVLGIHHPADGPPPADAWIVDLTTADPRVIPPGLPARGVAEQ